MNRLIYGGLVALEADTRVETAGELPQRLNVAPWGTHDTAKGRIIIGDTTARDLPAAQRATNYDRVALDFNHNTVPGSEAYRGEPAKVAGYGLPSVERGVGIILSSIQWTPEGATAVQGKHYIDLSPTLQLNQDGEAIFLHSAALCRQGAIPGLSLFAADPLAASAANMAHWWLLQDLKHPLAAMLDEPVKPEESVKLEITQQEVLIAIWVFTESVPAFLKLQESREAFDAAAFAFAATISVHEIPALMQKLQKVIADIPARLAPPPSKQAKQAKPAKK